MPSVLALIELDGVARRLVLAPPDVSPAHWDAVVAQAEVEVSIVDPSDCAGPRTVSCGPVLAPRAADRRASYDTEWVLFTSGTTGAPKLVSHTLPGLTGPIAAPPGSAAPGGAMPPSATPGGAVWSTFYDVRRYGGLQILLRALLGGGSHGAVGRGGADRDISWPAPARRG